MKNPVKTWLFLAVLSMTFLFIGYSLGERQGTLIAFMASFGLFLAVLFHGSAGTLETFQSTPIEGQDPWGLLTAVARLSAVARVPAPQLHMISSSTPTAFSVGRNWNHAFIVVSEGLLARLSPQEVEAVLAFEIAQIRALDTLSFSVGRALASVIMFPAQALDHMFSVLLMRKPRTFDLFRSLFAPVAGICVRLCVHRSCFFDADRFAGHIVKDHERIARTLWKLQSYAYNHPMAAPPTTSHMFIINPLQGRSWTRHFHIQPHIARRIHRLVGRYPL